ncbi:MAG: UvrB/UvrC motif-containing protein [Phycisphaerales bacterium]
MAGTPEDGFGPHNCKDCRKCGRHPMLKDLVVHNGKKIERQLCEECVRAEGGALGSHQPIQELFTKLVISSAGGGAGERSGGGQMACPGCGLRFAQFRERGLLGCSECYRAFEEDLGPLIERAHEGGTHHIGKLPRRAGASQDRAQRVLSLRQQLREAVAREEYEKAASLRDELAKMERSTGRGVTGA